MKTSARGTPVGRFSELYQFWEFFVLKILPRYPKKFGIKIQIINNKIFLKIIIINFELKTQKYNPSGGEISDYV